MWVLKTHGETFYVNHVDCEIPWSTKETVDNPHTKGSIKVKDTLLQIDDENNARLVKLTFIDKVRLRNQKLGITRIIVKEGKDFWTFQNSLKQMKVKHGPIKSVGGACSSTFYITDILDKKHFSMLGIAMADSPSFRILMPNEGYYKLYDDPKWAKTDHVYEEDLEYADDED